MQFKKEALRMMLLSIIFKMIHTDIISF